MPAIDTTNPRSTFCCLNCTYYASDCLELIKCLTTNCTMPSTADVNFNTSGSQDSGELSGKDASWILTSAVIIFTMQTGFGLLEAGCVSPKSETNIMVKNALDVVFGGITYWACGFAFSFGTAHGSNAFIGLGSFFVQVNQNDDSLGFIYALFLFQLSFATTATTIVSGAMAERTKMVAYNCFSMLNTFLYSIPAHWLWAEEGFLYKMGALDVAGCGPVHLVGGLTGLIATLIIGPRACFVPTKDRPPLPSPLKAILGMFMLWWGWLRFNSGSVFIVSSSSQWQKAVRAAVNTIVASMGGGITSVVVSLITNKCMSRSRYDIATIINGVLGSLVSVTAICTLCAPWEAFVIGCVGAILTCAADHLILRVHIDDPVGVIPVHAVCSVWGLLSVGLFLPAESSTIKGQAGLLKSGQWYILGVQTLTVVAIAVWTIILSSIFLKVIDATIGLRLSRDEEILGADIIEHGSSSNVSELTLETLASSVEDNHLEFQKKAIDVLKDLLSSCNRNEFDVVVRHPGTDYMTLEFRMRSPTPSVDSGVEIHI